MTADEFLANLRKADSRAELDERIEYYSRAIRAWRTVNGGQLLAHCHFNRGEAHFLQARLDMAEADLNAALARDPGIARAYLLRGRLLLRTKRTARAGRDLMEYVSLKPNDAEGYVYLGESREKSGKLGEALKEYERAAAADPESWRALLSQARILAAQSKFDQAGRLIDQAQALTGERDAAVASQRGALFARMLRFEEALDRLDLGASLYERLTSDLQRAPDRALELRDARDALALTYHIRAGVREQRLEPGPALSDHREACRLGHAASCRRTQELAVKLSSAAEEPSRSAAKPAPTPKPASRPKTRKRPNSKSDPGERIYGS